MKVLVTGGRGQVARSLAVSAPLGADVEALSHAELDIGDESAVRARLDEVRPHVVINAAAYTAVDKAETEAGAAKRTNETGAANLARAAAAVRARIIHLSTDFVFDGEKSAPYTPDDVPRPLSVYGATKLAGEQAVLSTLPESALVLRTSWVYAAEGGNFVRTMLRLMRERGSVRVVADQIGTPTAAFSIAEAVWRAVDRPQVRGIHHWTDSGVATWYDFAVAIAEEAAALGLVPGTVQVVPIATHEYPTPARRPRFSVMDTSGTIAALDLVPAHWRRNLGRVLGEIQLA